MSIFKQFDAIISALNKREYNSYVKNWYGKRTKDDMKNSVNFPDIYELYNISNMKEFDAWMDELMDVEEYRKVYSDLEDYVMMIRKMLKNKDFTVFREEVVNFLEDLYDTYMEDKKQNDKDIDNAEDIRKVYDKLFSGKYRLVFPLKEEDISFTMPENTYEKYARYISRIAYKVFMSIGNIEEAESIRHAINTDEDIRDYSKSKMYTFFSDPKRQIRLGKLLQTYKEKFYGKEHEELLDQAYKKVLDIYDLASKNSKYKDLVAIISRHPYDIAGMSTHRNSWKSCMNLIDGEYRSYVRSTLLNGGLVCYVCRKNDTTDIVDSKGNHHKNNKYNIQDPLGRFLIKPYYRNGDRGFDFKNPNFILVCSRCFGNFAEGATKPIQEWLDENWNKYIEGTTFVFDKNKFYFEDGIDKKYIKK